MTKANTLLKFIIGLFVSLLLIFLDQLSCLDWLRGSIETITRPQSRTLKAVSQQLNTAFQTVRFVRSGPQRIADLERRLIAAQHQAATREKIKQENEGLRKALGSSVTRSLQLTPAKVLGFGQSLIIEQSDFSVGQVVISPDGSMIGIVDQIGKWSARVRQLTDSGSQIDIEVINTKGEKIASGILIGAFGGSATVDRILTEVELEPDQLIVTSGDDNQAPSGLLVGWISDQIEREESSIYQRAQLDPAVQLSELTTVLVVKRKLSL